RERDHGDARPHTQGATEDADSMLPDQLLGPVCRGGTDRRGRRRIWPLVGPLMATTTLGCTNCRAPYLGRRRAWLGRADYRLYLFDGAHPLRCALQRS